MDQINRTTYTINYIVFTQTDPFENLILLKLLFYMHIAAHFLEPGDSILIENQGSSLRVFCHNAKSKYLIHIWRTIIVRLLMYYYFIRLFKFSTNLILKYSFQMNLDTNLENYELYDGRTPNEVTKKYEDRRRSWNFNFFSTKSNKKFSLNPFEDACIGIYAPFNHYQYKVSMRELR